MQLVWSRLAKVNNTRCVTIFEEPTDVLISQGKPSRLPVLGFLRTPDHLHPATSSYKIRFMVRPQRGQWVTPCVCECELVWYLTMDLCNWKFHWERTITARQKKVHKSFTAIAGSILATQCEELRHPSFKWCQYCSCSFVERPPLVVAAVLPLLLPGALWIDSRPRWCWKAETWILGLCAPCISYTILYIYRYVFQCVCILYI